MPPTRPLAVFLALSLLAACGGPAAPTPSALPQASATSAPTDSATEPPAPSAAPTETAAPEGELPNSRYSLDVVFDPDDQQIEVDERIEYVNASGQALNELLLVVEAVPLGGDFRLDTLAWANGQSVPETDFEAGLLRVPLPESLMPGDSLGLLLHYRLGLPAAASWLGYTARQSNFVDWYPFVPPYQAGSGWLVHPAGAVGEHLAYDSADFEVHIRVLGGQQMVLAAAAPAGAEDGGWAYHLEDARRFVWSASRHYETISRNANGIPVTAYVYAEHRLAGEASVETCVQALQRFQALFGPYPYHSLAIVEADFPDGMESDGLFFLDQTYFNGYTGGIKNYLTALSAHEVSHNWWFGQVGNDQALEPWLDEALAIYSEELFYEGLSPSLVDWWWTFRITSYAPQGQVDSSIYDHDAFAPYVQAVYMRGALFLQELRRRMGDDAFLAFLKQYAQAGKGRIMTADDFFGLLADTGDYDLASWKGEYFGLGAAQAP